MSGVLLRGEELTYTRQGRAILDAVSIEAHPGERLAVTGPSGAGKSTLLAILAGLEPPDRGRVLLGDTLVTPGVDPRLRRRFGIVFQSYGLLSLLTAAENVELALQVAGRPRREVRERAREVLAAVGLASRGDHLTEELSGGEQQRVAIARALAGRPDVLVADEPTAELDAENRNRALTQLLDAAGSGTTVIIATHDPDVADRCDRVIHLEAGHIQRLS